MTSTSTSHERIRESSKRAKNAFFQMVKDILREKRPTKG